MSRSQRGFTLIELMVVIAVIAILSAIAVPQYQSHIRRMKCQDAKAILLAAAAAAMERYRAQHGSYKGADLTKLGYTQSPVSGKAIFKVNLAHGQAASSSGCNLHGGIADAAARPDAKEHFCITMAPEQGSGMEYGKADAMMSLDSKGVRSSKGPGKTKVIWDNDCRGI